MIRYLTGSSNPAIMAVAHERNIGLLAQPGNSYDLLVKHYPYWAADNGCFAQGEDFQLEDYLQWLKRNQDQWLKRNQDQASSCLFATAPDFVGDMLRTWARSVDVLPELRAMGFPAALVGQNGLRYDYQTDSLHVCRDDRDPTSWGGVVIPWDSFDWLFLGGDDRWKLSLVRQHTLVWAAKLHGKRVHMGRVNSYHRLQQAQWFGCDTADGTFLKFASRENQAAGVTRLTAWLDKVWEMPA